MGAYMANVTRIKAKDSKSSEKSSGSASDAEISRKVSIKAKNSENKKLRTADKKALKAKAKAIRTEKIRKTEFDGIAIEIPKWLKPLWVISAPFRAIGRYFRDSFRELRQVRWPNRKNTWKITFSVILYVVVIVIFIMLLDALLKFLSDKLLGGTN